MVKYFIAGYRYRDCLKSYPRDIKGRKGQNITMPRVLITWLITIGIHLSVGIRMLISDGAWCYHVDVGGKLIYHTSVADACLSEAFLMAHTV